MTAAKEIDRATEARQAVAANRFWYHTIEVAPGVVTPGWFDQRPVIDRLPWPEVRGRRCLDVGTADGHLAFELERRGASEVVATDVASHDLWDYPRHIRRSGVDYWNALAGERKGEGFRVARSLLGSRVRSLELSAYDLDPERMGRFDVVVCGALLLHLRDPVRALEAMRSVCAGSLLITNQIALKSLILRRTPVAVFDAMSDFGRWWLPNPLGNRRMVESAGFQVERESGIYAVPFGAGHTPRAVDARALARKLALRAIAGNDGVPHHALLARPTS